MEPTTQGNSTGLFVGIILGILILGGIFLYMRGNNSAEAPKDTGSVEINVPVGGGEKAQ